MIANWSVIDYIGTYRTCSKLFTWKSPPRLDCLAYEDSPPKLFTLASGSKMGVKRSHVGNVFMALVGNFSTI